jgi:hypothetical protein
MNLGRLAASLLRKAIVALSELPADGRAEPLRALDAFIAAPGPSSYLRASCALRQARLDLRLSGLRERGAARSYLRGLDRLRAVDAALAGELSSVPVDPASGARLGALAALVEAERELSERVAAQADALRRQLADFNVEEKPRRHVSSTRRRSRR